MAEIQTNSSTKQKGVKRVNKKNTRVDLTPMVDLGFLLITFFVFTTTMAKPKVMDLVVPHDTKDEPTKIAESTVLTVILDKQNKIYYYEGMPENFSFLKQTDFSADGIRNVIMAKKKRLRATGKEDDMVLIVKPSDESSFKNFVDMMDEVNINVIKHYFVDEMNDLDKQLLKKSTS